MGLLGYELVGTLFCISLFFNVYQFLEYRKKLKALEKSPGMDARQLLHDLTKGKALIEVRPLDPQGIFIFNPHSR